MERELIAFGLRQGKSFREIGAWIGRDHSVVSREVDRNGGREVYSPLVAQRRADRLRKRPKERKVLKSPFLTRVVHEGLRKKWSPMQIACRLRLDHPMDHSRWVSHEAIYQALFVQAKGTLRAEVAEGLRQGRIKRRARSRGAELRGKIKDMVLISERPARGRGPCRTGLLGRRSDRRREQSIADRDPGRTAYSICHAGAYSS
nr:IS30 family transposase [Amycolatopsis sp. TNS106]